MDGCLRHMEVFLPNTQKPPSQLLGKIDEQNLSSGKHQGCTGTEPKLWLEKDVGKGERIGAGDTKGNWRLLQSSRNGARAKVRK